MCFLMLTSSLEVAKTKTKSIWFDKSALLNVQISALLHRMLSFCSFCSTLQPGFRTFANRYHVSPWWRITSSSWQVNCSDSTTHHEVNDPWYTCPSAVAASRNGISSTCQTNTGVGSIHQHLHFVRYWQIVARSLWCCWLRERRLQLPTYQRLPCFKPPPPQWGYCYDFVTPWTTTSSFCINVIFVFLFKPFRTYVWIACIIFLF